MRTSFHFTTLQVTLSLILTLITSSIISAGDKSQNSPNHIFFSFCIPFWYFKTFLLLFHYPSVSVCHSSPLFAQPPCEPHPLSSQGPLNAQPTSGSGSRVINSLTEHLPSLAICYTAQTLTNVQLNITSTSIYSTLRTNHHTTLGPVLGISVLPHAPRHTPLFTSLVNANAFLSC